MGKFNAVPKHAQWIADLFINARVTPTVVAPRIIRVMIKAI